MKEEERHTTAVSADTAQLMKYEGTNPGLIPHGDRCSARDGPWLLHIFVSTTLFDSMLEMHTHQNPRTVRIQIIPKTMADQRHGLDLVHVGVTEEVGCPETLE